MTVLSSEQRTLLSDVVVRARDVVEAACAQRIAALGVAADKAPAVLTEQERAVRVGLRARARQLGSVDALVTEAGFEHWHRMLFARFLADNQLLVDDQFGQPLTMDEVAEYAAETGEMDQWEVAARFATAMLPGIFSQGDPVLAMRLPVETREALERLLDRLPEEVITAEDSLGWVYQYWQAKRKAEVNQLASKVGGADLAPVTQLFTESYMVRFLLENSLGAWWAARHPDSPLLSDWAYLRRNDDGSPAVGRFDGWPDRVAEVTVMDPCCGSGHFLTAAFGMLWRMRAEEENLHPLAAQNAVLRDNLFGLELDPRCTQIATFALALEAWKAGGYRDLPLPNVACCGIPARAPLSEWLDLAGGDPMVEAALARLHALFVNADTLGSLIDPVRAAEQAGLESVDWHTVAPLVQRALAAESGDHANDPASLVFGAAAAGIARAADYLSRQYTIVSTNPPYLVRGNQSVLLQRVLDTDFTEGRQDLATAFLQRAWRLLAPNGTSCLVTPQTWTTLISYKALRFGILKSRRIVALAALGSGAFGAISGEVVNVVLTVISSEVGHGDSFVALDVTRPPFEEKARTLRLATLTRVSPGSLLAHPDGLVLTHELPPNPLLARFAEGLAGIQSGDLPRFGRYFWEFPEIDSPWSRLIGTVAKHEPWSGREKVMRWGEGSLAAQVGVFVRGRAAWGRSGVAVSQMGSLAATLYAGELYDNNLAAIIPRDESLVPALWCFLTSPEYFEAVRNVSPKVSVQAPTLVKVPFDAEYWRSVAFQRYPTGLPEPKTDDPTQWFFRGAVPGSRHPLQVAAARLLGFRWPDQEPESLDALADADGIVCIPALGGETGADERFRDLLSAALGEAWTPHAVDTLLGEAGIRAGAAALTSWLRDGFFKDHCKVFANRPFIWQIWDGRPDGFSALVNYHKLDRKLLERLTYDYLGSWWIGRMNDEVRREVPGAEVRLLAAEELKRKLRLILEGEPPYDIYVRWKSLAEQPMGWAPDLDDGVRLNSRPFMMAGVLRAKPNIKWEKDRGKNPDGTERLNDLHFTLAEKRAARGGAGR